MSSSLRGKKVVIFGGNGFIGSHLVNYLCNESCQVKIVSRQEKVNKKFFFGSEPGQVTLEKIEYNEQYIDKVTDGCDIIFNLIGILYESKTSSFNFAHNEIPIMIGKCARKNKVRSLIHISALNVNKITNSKYAYSKSLGEAGIKKHFPEAIIVRPGVVFGKGDNFTNFFCNMSKFSPFLPLIGTPKIDLSKNLISIFNFKKKVKFQPLYVGDLAKFLTKVAGKKNKIYDLAGPSVLSFNEIFDLILNFKKRKRLYIPVPFFEAKILAFFLELFPKPLLTRDQINLLQYDSVSSRGLSNLKSVVKNPVGIETAISKYL